LDATNYMMFGYKKNTWFGSWDSLGSILICFNWSSFYMLSVNHSLILSFTCFFFIVGFFFIVHKTNRPKQLLKFFLVQETTVLTKEL
jgi:hypothetical protein